MCESSKKSGVIDGYRRDRKVYTGHSGFMLGIMFTTPAVKGQAEARAITTMAAGRVCSSSHRPHRKAPTTTTWQMDRLGQR